MIVAISAMLKLSNLVLSRSFIACRSWRMYWKLLVLQLMLLPQLFYFGTFEKYGMVIFFFAWPSTGSRFLA